MSSIKSDVFSIIGNALPKMSKGQKAISEFILTNYEKAAYLTAARIADHAKVSESTVVRFASELGFDGFPDFQKKLREDLKVKLTSVERLHTYAHSAFAGDLAKAVIKSDIEKLNKTLTLFEYDEFNRACDLIMQGGRIFIVGVRSSATLASFLGFYMNLMFDNVVLVDTISVSEIFEQIIHVKEGDTVIGIGFPRYSKKTIRAMHYCREKGAKVVAITDKLDSPLAGISHAALLAPSDVTSFVDSLVAPLSIIKVLLVELGNRNKQTIEKTFSSLEQLWDDYDVYDKGDGS